MLVPMSGKPEPTAPAKQTALERIRDLGVQPRTIFDVGVATGTPGLYGVFEDVRYVMVEPLTESEPFIQRLLDAYPGSLAIRAAAGPAAGESTFVVDPGLSGSSFLFKRKFGEARTVPVVTIDQVVREHGLEGPFLLKLDVQGYELQVLEGCAETLRDTQAVVVEASLWGDLKQRGIATFSDMVAWFTARGFVLYDVIEITRRKSDNAIAEMDLMFCPADSPLRAVRSYRSDEERRQTNEMRRRKFGLD